MTNPLLDVDALPAFSVIRPEHVEPAIDQVLADNRAQIEALCALNEVDYENFAAVLEQIGDRLAKTWSPVSHLNSVCNAPALRLAFNACLPKLTQYWTEMGQNDRLFAGYKALRGRAALTAEETKVVADAVRDFRLAGVELSGDARTRYGAIALRLSELTAKYSENLLDATDAWHKSLPEADLRGLPETALASARAAGAARGDSACVISLEQPSYVAVMTYAEDRALRREVYEAYMTRASERGPSAGVYDNGAIMDEILSLRHEMAALLGFASFAGLSLATKMAQTPAQVLAFLRGLASKSLPAARHELDALQTFARDQLGIADLSAWDSAFAAERLRQARYAVSQELLRPYFPVGRVLDGMFEIVRRIYGIDVVEVAGPEVWHPSVRAFEVRRAGLLVGQFFLDAYARENKRGGAWMDECRVRRRARDGLQLPVAYLVCNFTAPLGDRPALLNHSEVTTLFHEFGHGLHLLMTQVERAPVAGINGVPWDAVELPSQFMENWCYDPAAIALISGHHETGEPLPATLLTRMLEAKNFQSAMAMVRQIELAMFDMRIYDEYQPGEAGFIRRVLHEVRAEVAVLPAPDFARFENGFDHIFSGGYAAGYYSYKWAEVLSADAYSAFEEEGVFNPATGERFRSTILARGGVVDPADAFIAFRGRPPSEAALLRHSGITAGAS